MTGVVATSASRSIQTHGIAQPGAWLGVVEQRCSHVDVPVRVGAGLAGRTSPSGRAPACRSRSRTPPRAGRRAPRWRAARRRGSPGRCWTGWPASSPGDAARSAPRAPPGRPARRAASHPAPAARPGGTVRPSAAATRLEPLGEHLPVRDAPAGLDARLQLVVARQQLRRRRRRARRSRSAARSPPIQSMSVP